ncbi:MAG: UbiX family flavin prenyltransferase [Desulfovibrio sp.]|nr:UbiX family flavin prenyltransferase [Desulfovibrio sp.]
MPNNRLLFAITGASGMPLAYALLRSFRKIPDLDIHLIISHNAKEVLNNEVKIPNLQALAQQSYKPDEWTAPPASGSWQAYGMIICPCSMASLAAIATGVGSNLIHRAADVTLKERRPLIIIPRETPLNTIHLTNMLRLAKAGATIMPFMPAYYTKLPDLNALMQNFAGRVLDQFHIAHSLCKRWREDITVPEEMIEEKRF